METCECGELVERHDKDLYRGNGKPGLITRMAVVEERADTTDGAVKELSTRLWYIVAGVAGTFLTVLGELIFNLAKK